MESPKQQGPGGQRAERGVDIIHAVQSTGLDPRGFQQGPTQRAFMPRWQETPGQGTGDGVREGLTAHGPVSDRTAIEKAPGWLDGRVKGRTVEHPTVKGVLRGHRRAGRGKGAYADGRQGPLRWTRAAVQTPPAGGIDGDGLRAQVPTPVHDRRDLRRGKTLAPPCQIQGDGVKAFALAAHVYADHGRIGHRDLGRGWSLVGLRGLDHEGDTRF